MKKLFILFGFLFGFFLANQFSCVRAQTAESIKDALAALSNEFLGQASLVERSPFSAKEIENLSKVLKNYSSFLDERSKIKTDPDLINYDTIIRNAANKLIELQKLISTEIEKHQKIAQRIKSPEQIKYVTQFIKQVQSELKRYINQLDEVANKYKTLSKGIKLWTSDKKRAWELMNEYTQFLKTLYEKMSRDLDFLTVL